MSDVSVDGSQDGSDCNCHFCHPPPSAGFTFVQTKGLDLIDFSAPQSVPPIKDAVHFHKKRDETPSNRLPPEPPAKVEQASKPKPPLPSTLPMPETIECERVGATEAEPREVKKTDLKCANCMESSDVIDVLNQGAFRTSCTDGCTLTMHRACFEKAVGSGKKKELKTCTCPTDGCAYSVTVIDYRAPGTDDNYTLWLRCEAKEGEKIKAAEKGKEAKKKNDEKKEKGDKYKKEARRDEGEENTPPPPPQPAAAASDGGEQRPIISLALPEHVVRGEGQETTTARRLITKPLPADLQARPMEKKEDAVVDKYAVRESTAVRETKKKNKKGVQQVMLPNLSVRGQKYRGEEPDADEWSPPPAAAADVEEEAEVQQQQQQQYHQQHQQQQYNQPPPPLFPFLPGVPPPPAGHQLGAPFSFAMPRNVPFPPQSGYGQNMFGGAPLFLPRQGGGDGFRPQQHQQTMPNDSSTPPQRLSQPLQQEQHQQQFESFSGHSDSLSTEEPPLIENTEDFPTLAKDSVRAREQLKNFFELHRPVLEENASYGFGREQIDLERLREMLANFIEFQFYGETEERDALSATLQHIFNGEVQTDIVPFLIDLQCFKCGYVDGRLAVSVKEEGKLRREREEQQRTERAEREKREKESEQERQKREKEAAARRQKEAEEEEKRKVERGREEVREAVRRLEEKQAKEREEREQLRLLEKKMEEEKKRENEERARQQMREEKIRLEELARKKKADEEERKRRAEEEKRAKEEEERTRIEWEKKEAEEKTMREEQERIEADERKAREAREMEESKRDEEKRRVEESARLVEKKKKEEEERKKRIAQLMEDKERMQQEELGKKSTDKKTIEKDLERRTRSAIEDIRKNNKKGSSSDSSPERKDEPSLLATSTTSSSFSTLAPPFHPRSFTLNAASASSSALPSAASVAAAASEVTLNPNAPAFVPSSCSSSSSSATTVHSETSLADERAATEAKKMDENAEQLKSKMAEIEELSRRMAQLECEKAVLTRDAELREKERLREESLRFTADQKKAEELKKATADAQAWKAQLSAKKLEMEGIERELAQKSTRMKQMAFDHDTKVRNMDTEYSVVEETMKAEKRAKESAQSRADHVLWERKKELLERKERAARDCVLVCSDIIQRLGMDANAVGMVGIFGELRKRWSEHAAVLARTLSDAEAGLAVDLDGALSAAGPSMPRETEALVRESYIFHYGPMHTLSIRLATIVQRCLRHHGRNYEDAYVLGIIQKWMRTHKHPLSIDATVPQVTVQVANMVAIAMGDASLLPPKYRTPSPPAAAATVPPRPPIGAGGAGPARAPPTAAPPARLADPWKKNSMKVREVDLDTHECLICLEPMSNGEVSRCEQVSCNEPYHTQCLDKVWRADHSLCPKCRQPMPPRNLFPALG